MHTRISRATDRLLEAIVLTAVLVTPLFFNPYSARVFEGEKVSLLRALSAIAAVTWLIRYLEVRGNSRPSSVLSSLRQQPVILAALFTGLVTIMAGLTSIAPRLSLWGSYQRGQGIITTVCYLILFFVTVTLFSDPDRRRRLIATMVVASGPIAILSILQYAGLNPVPLRSLDPARVFATLANPIFLGAYLVMVIPLTLAQIARYRVTTRGVRWGGVTAYVLLLVLQMAAAVFSGSRGPLIGVVTGVFLFGFLLALQNRRRGLAAGLLAVLVLGVASVILLALPNAALISTEGVPVVERFGQGLSGGSGRVRVLIWQGIMARFAGEPARLALGYGPESTHAALLPTYQPELRHLEPERLPDRAHNVFLEALVTTGLAGTTAVVVLFAAVFYTGLRGLGWISSVRSRNEWLALTLAGITLGLFGPRLVEGSWVFAGLGLALGLAAGLVAFLAWCLGRSGPDDGPGLTDHSILIAGILAALAGHLVEVAVGIRVTATESLFWVLAGLLSISDPSTGSGRRFGFRIVEEKSEIRNPKTWDPEPAVLGLLGGLMLSTLSFGVFLLPGVSITTSAVGRWILLIGTWLLAGLLWFSPPDAENKPGAGRIYLLMSLAWGGFFLALRGIVEVLGGDAITLLNVHFVWLPFSLFVIALALPSQVGSIGDRPQQGAFEPRARSETGHSKGRSPSKGRSWRALGALGYPVLGVIALGLVAWLAVRPLYADIYLEAAQANAVAGQWAQALALYQKSVDEAPGVDVYQQHLGEAFVTAARLTADLGQREALFQAGEQAFREAVALNPAEGTHLFNLTHLYLLWGQATADPGRRAALLNQAANLYAQTSARIPNDPRVLTEWGLVLQEQGNIDAALARYREALTVDPRDAQAYLQLGILYQQSGKTEQALQMYQQAIDLEPDRAEAYRAMADLYRQAGRLMDAVAAQQRAAELRPTDYTIHQNLALLYRDLGQIQNAVAEATLALNYAPPERREALERFIQSLLTSNSP